MINLQLLFDLLFKILHAAHHSSHVIMAVVYELHGGVMVTMTVVITLMRETAVSMELLQFGLFLMTLLSTNTQENQLLSAKDSRSLAIAVYHIVFTPK